MGLIGWILNIVKRDFLKESQKKGRDRKGHMNSFTELSYVFILKKV